MARKTTGNTPTRSKKIGASVQPGPVACAPEVSKDIRKDARKNGKPANLAPANLEEEIRRRAYELYLQRRATASSESGNQNQDWLLAEREIRLRHGSQEQHSA